MKIKIGILGATGYTGYEIVKALEAHPAFELIFVTSEKNAGELLGDYFPAMGPCFSAMRFITSAEATKIEVTGVFSCLPHEASADTVAPFVKKGCVVVDLSADFRMKSKEVYEKYYSKHSQPELIGQSCYGLTELNRAEVAGSKLIGNPGCYPTSILLPLIPLLQRGLINRDGIICDSKSGVSGAGKSATPTTHFMECHDNFAAYKVANEHRHLSEINEQLSLAANSSVEVLFTPHLLPIARGILSTIYCDLAEGVTEQVVRDAWEEVYGSSVFVKTLKSGFPKTSWVRNTNRCMIGAKVVGNKLVIISVIDNLLKGASGQALQNMNIALGLEESLGLPG